MDGLGPRAPEQRSDLGDRVDRLERDVAAVRQQLDAVVAELREIRRHERDIRRHERETEWGWAGAPHD